ncbi:MAG: hypothetical protein AAFO07_25630 [Bacteroidota bacterium]
MEANEIKALLEKYFNGMTNIREEALLRTFFQQDNDLGELEVYRAEFLVQNSLQAQEVEVDFKSELLEQYSAHSTVKLAWLPNRQTLQIAASILLLVTAFLLGRWSDQKPTRTSEEIAGLQSEINALRLMTAEVLLRQPAASERLEGIEMLTQLSQNNPENYYDLLFRSLNEDQNPNVRLASLNALHNIERTPRLEELLFQSLLSQDSPILQLELLMMLQRLEIKLDQQYLERLEQKEDLDQDIKKVIEENFKI